MTQDKEIMLLLEEAAKLDVQVDIKGSRVVLTGMPADIDAVLPALKFHRDRLWTLLAEAKYNAAQLIEKVMV